MADDEPADETQTPDEGDDGEEEKSFRERSKRFDSAVRKSGPSSRR